MSLLGPAGSLARDNAIRLALVFIAFEVLVVISVVGLLMIPMGRRAADDLAGLMLLSATSLQQLPEKERPAFATRLMDEHLLGFRPDTDWPPRDEWHGFFMYFLEQALEQRTGHKQHIAREERDGEEWYWVVVPAGGALIGIGFPERRADTHPLPTLLLTGGAALLLALLAAAWLARRTVVPLARLDAAAEQLGRGESPQLLPEAGPRELAGLARRFNLMARQVRDLLLARTVLLAGISHDLRTPLARIRLALAIVAEKPTPALISRIEQDIEEMDRLIGQVLGLARDLDHEPATELDLVPLLSGLLAALPPGRYRLEAVREHVTVLAPPTAMRRVLGNLLENAGRYGGDEVIDIHVAQEGQGASISIRDHGPGIPPEQIDAVFQPFHRVDSSRCFANGGSGLGLSIVRQLVDAYGWEIRLRNLPVTGLEAVLTIPG